MERRSSRKLFKMKDFLKEKGAGKRKKQPTNLGQEEVGEYKVVFLQEWHWSIRQMTLLMLIRWFLTD